MKAEWAVTAWARMRGLLGRSPHDMVLVLAPCKAVHTFGMTHPIDIAFISHDGYVLRVSRFVGRCRHLKERSAVAVIERFSREGTWLQQGDYVGVGCVRLLLGRGSREVAKVETKGVRHESLSCVQNNAF